MILRSLIVEFGSKVSCADGSFLASPWILLKTTLKMLCGPKVGKSFAGKEDGGLGFLHVF